jgi:glycosyltransferase involved in cell wall biosynthesis
MTKDGRVSHIISLILPVHNAGEYIRECLQSIASQEFDGVFEVILVDDCSTDDSVTVCREFVRRYPFLFNLIECESNAGVSVARNIGLELASGKYLMFVDSDDILPQHSLSSLVSSAEACKADIVKGNITYISESSSQSAPDHISKKRILRGEKILEALFDHDEVRGHVHGKLFRRKKFGDLRFATGVNMAEDLLYFSAIFAKADSLVLICDLVYCYRKHQEGLSSVKYEKGTYVDWLEAVDQSGQFATTKQQRRAHKRLQVRTLTQLSREARKIPSQYTAAVLEQIEHRIMVWNLRLLPLLISDRVGVRSLLRYLKLLLALIQVRNKVQQA